MGIGLCRLRGVGHEASPLLPHAAARVLGRALSGTGLAAPETCRPTAPPAPAACEGAQHRSTNTCGRRASRTQHRTRCCTGKPDLCSRGTHVYDSLRCCATAAQHAAPSRALRSASISGSTSRSVRICAAWESPVWDSWSKLLAFRVEPLQGYAAQDEPRLCDTYCHIAHPYRHLNARPNPTPRFPASPRQAHHHTPDAPTHHSSLPLITESMVT
jgi:hypothetical protein